MTIMLRNDEFAFTLRPAVSFLKMFKYLGRPLWFFGFFLLITNLLLRSLRQQDFHASWEPLAFFAMLALLAWSICSDVWTVVNGFLLEESLELKGEKLKHSRKLCGFVVYKRDFLFNRTGGFQFHFVPERVSIGKYPVRIPPFNTLQFHSKGQEILIFKNIPKDVAEEVAAQLNARNPNTFQ